MTKLFTILTLVAALGTGCRNKEHAGTEHQPVTAPKPTEPAAPRGQAKPQEKAPEAMTLPAECTEYRATVERIRTCAALPQATRDALAQAYTQASSGWANATSPEMRESLAASCRSANDAIKQSAAACP
jgi:hypothetical protein